MSAFAAVVLRLHDQGLDIPTARFAAGQATIRLPEGQLGEVLELAAQIAVDREMVYVNGRPA